MARVLVVDDHEDSRDLVAIMLGTAGHQALYAADGDEALAVLKREAVDLALVDIFLPVKDGITLIGEIRRDFPTVKIVAVSAGWSPKAFENGEPQCDLGVLSRARALGAEGALPKPLVMEALVALIEGLIDPQG